MARTTILAATLVILAAPAFAQTAAGPAAETTIEAAPATTPSTSSAPTTLPGVTDTTTTGSTTPPTGAADQERCRVSGAQTDTNPTADMPSLTEADPACR